jgi:hypothetical protein
MPAKAKITNTPHPFLPEERRNTAAQVKTSRIKLTALGMVRPERP